MRNAECGRRNALAALGGGMVALFAACSPPSGPEVRLTIRKGSPFREAAESLAAHRVVRSGRVFAFYAKLRGHDRSLRYGTYALRQRITWEQTLDALRAGRGIVHTVTIPEGWAIGDIAPALAEALDLSRDSIDVAVRDTALLHRLDVPTPTLEGYLFPDTYTFADRTSARDAVRVMVNRFERAWLGEWDARLRELRLSRHDVVTLASIVEQEVRRPEERPVVAAVYLNRLRHGMELQADPTILYALGRKPGRVTLRDLRVRSPYNTYRTRGLPPGPIASPGTASLEATLFPAKVSYRFFVAAPDGHHEFRRTYREHLEAIRMVRAQAEAAEAAKADTAKPNRATRDAVKPR